MNICFFPLYINSKSRNFQNHVISKSRYFKITLFQNHVIQGITLFFNIFFSKSRYFFQ